MDREAAPKCPTKFLLEELSTPVCDCCAADREQARSYNLLVSYALGISVKSCRIR